tara:strand:- start:132 stop:353 length:222 start_codon:yes stop_codon:yes gene_type:complete
MTKLFDCPYCEAKQVPLRNDAEACSNKCRKRKQRIKDKTDKSDHAIQEYADLFCNGNFNLAKEQLAQKGLNNE